MTDERAPKPITEQLAEEILRAFMHFQPGGKFAPIDDPVEYEKLCESLPPAERELNRAFIQFAQLMDYFERQNIELGKDVADAISAAVRLPTLEEQAARIRETSAKLMERINDAGHGTSVRV